MNDSTALIPSEIVYLLTNPAMPDLVKIGRTGNLEKRVRELNSVGVPLPFEVYYACAVRDAYRVEKALHVAFGDHRLNSKREFFRINPERPTAILQLLEIKDVTPADDFVDSPDEQAALDKAKNRKTRFTFREVNISVGTVLTFLHDENITAKVADDRRIEFGGEITSLSAAATRVLSGSNRSTVGRIQGMLYWAYEGETLHERRIRFEQDDDSSSD